MKLAFALAPAIIICGATQVSQAGLIVFSGTTSGGPTWIRPAEGSPPTGTSGGAGYVPYQVQPLYVTGTAQFDLVSEVPGNPDVTWDHFTLLYQDEFDPLNPLVNVLLGNDDLPETGGLQSGFLDVLLHPGIQYFFVTTAFSEWTRAGTFENTITGPAGFDVGLGSPPAIPEPSSLALLGLMISGAFALSRRAGCRKSAGPVQS
jgi:hypothetical protein